MSSVPAKPVGTSGETYTPGYVGPKRLLVLAGVLLSAIGLAQLATPLRLTVFGVSATAEAIRVVKEKPGGTPLALTDEIRVHQALETRDRSYVFWNEFRFTAPDGRVVEVRCPIGTQLKPLYPLTDADGLPTTDLVRFDADDPAHAVFPLVLGTWLAPAVLLLLGIGATVIGAVLLRWARVPLAVPRVSDPFFTRPPMPR